MILIVLEGDTIALVRTKTKMMIVVFNCLIIQCRIEFRVGRTLQSLLEYVCFILGRCDALGVCSSDSDASPRICELGATTLETSLSVLRAHGVNQSRISRMSHQMECIYTITQICDDLSNFQAFDLCPRSFSSEICRTVCTLQSPTSDMKVRHRSLRKASTQPKASIQQVGTELTFNIGPYPMVFSFSPDATPHSPARTCGFFRGRKNNPVLGQTIDFRKKKRKYEHAQVSQWLKF